MYSWSDELGAHPDTKYLQDGQGVWSLAKAILFTPHQHVLFIGYTEWPYRALMLMCWALRRRFLYWTDHPEDVTKSFFHRLARAATYWLLRTGAQRILVVGRHTVEWFKNVGFPQSALENFPIFIDLPTPGRYSVSDRKAMRAKYRVPNGGTFIVSGSRLIRDKGFDVLIDALARLPVVHRSGVRALIVGKGPERCSLEAQAVKLGLGASVQFEDWLSAGDFEAVTAAADIFVHPSRFDAFGGGTLVAMAVGVPVIGSDGAGVVRERVIEGVNGYMVPKSNVDALANSIERFLVADERERQAMRQGARETAENWSPEIGARRLHELVGHELKSETLCK